MRTIFKIYNSAVENSFEILNDIDLDFIRGGQDESPIPPIVD